MNERSIQIARDLGHAIGLGVAKRQFDAGNYAKSNMPQWDVFLVQWLGSSRAAEAFGCDAVDSVFIKHLAAFHEAASGSWKTAEVSDSPLVAAHFRDHWIQKAAELCAGRQAIGMHSGNLP